MVWTIHLKALVSFITNIVQYHTLKFRAVWKVVQNSTGYQHQKYRFNEHIPRTTIILLCRIDTTYIDVPKFSEDHSETQKNFFIILIDGTLIVILIARKVTISLYRICKMSWHIYTSCTISNSMDIHINYVITLWQAFNNIIIPNSNWEWQSTNQVWIFCCFRD